MQNEIETWAQALKAYEEDDFAKALDLFGVRVPRPPCPLSVNGLDPGRWWLIQISQRIAESGKTHTNIGIIYATIGEHDSAVRPAKPFPNNPPVFYTHPRPQRSTISRKLHN